jgi:hypothetical protein
MPGLTRCDGLLGGVAQSLESNGLMLGEYD